MPGSVYKMDSRFKGVDVQDLASHYSSAELQNLYEATNKVCMAKQSGVALTLIKRKFQ